MDHRRQRLNVSRWQSGKGVVGTLLVSTILTALLILTGIFEIVPVISPLPFLIFASATALFAWTVALFSALRARWFGWPSAIALTPVVLVFVLVIMTFFSPEFDTYFLD